MSAVSFSSLCEHGSKIQADCGRVTDQLLVELVVSMCNGNLFSKLEPSISMQIYKGVSFIIASIEDYPEKQESLLALAFRNIFNNVEALLEQRRNSRNEASLQTSIALHFEIRKMKQLLSAFER